MNNSKSSQAIPAVLIATVIFLVAIVIPKLIISNAILRIATTQASELILSLVAIAIFGRRKFSQYGFIKPQIQKDGQDAGSYWLKIILFAPLLGIVSTPMILLMGGGGNPLIKSLSFPQIILFVWFLSSTIEEVFTRGFLLGHLYGLSGQYVRIFSWRVELPVLISALFFSCMHFVLLTAGVDAVTMTVIFLFTFSIGLMAGHYRSKTGSLIPAIAVHFLANIGGVIGGVIYTVAKYLITGKLPGAA